MMRVDYFGIILLWFARVLYEGYIAMWCNRAAWLNLVLTSSLVFLMLAPLILVANKRWVFFPLYVYIHIPLVTLLWDHTANDHTHYGLGSVLMEQAMHLGGGSGSHGNGAMADISTFYTGAAISLLGSACGVVGASVFLTRFPERLYPGYFDIWGASHQWWHVFTMVGPLLCLWGGGLMMEYRIATPCHV